MKIKSLRAFKVLNSRAQPTIAIQVNKSVWAGAPEGASAGSNEVPSFPKGVDVSIKVFNKINQGLNNLSIDKFSDLEKVESAISNKTRLEVLGGSAMIALEFALLKALAVEQGREVYQLFGKPRKFPLPLSNVIGGGAHAGIRSSDFQEFLLCPKVRTFSEAAFINASVHSALKSILTKKDPYFLGGKTDEGAWVTGLSTMETLQLLDDVCGDKIRLGIDAAASKLYHGGKYHFNNWSKTKKEQTLSKDAYYDQMLGLTKRLFYIEDPFTDSDFDSFSKLNSESKGALVCADDLACTNPILLDKILRLKAASAVIIKPNQIGSLLLAKLFLDRAKRAGLKIVVSHRSGELPDELLAHLALGWEADHFKCGIAGGERVAKINELIRIENL